MHTHTHRKIFLLFTKSRRMIYMYTSSLCTGSTWEFMQFRKRGWASCILNLHVKETGTEWYDLVLKSLINYIVHPYRQFCLLENNRAENYAQIRPMEIPNIYNQSRFARWWIKIFENSRTRERRVSRSTTREEEEVPFRFLSFSSEAGRGNRAGKPVFRSRLRQRTWTDWTLYPDATIPSTGEGPLFFFGGSLSSRSFSPSVPPLLRRMRLLKYAARRNRAHDWHINFALPVHRSCYHAFPPPTHPVAYQWRVPLDSRSSFVKIEYIIFEEKFCRTKKRYFKENFEKEFLCNQVTCNKNYEKIYNIVIK